MRACGGCGKMIEGDTRIKNLDGTQHKCRWTDAQQSIEEAIRSACEAQLKRRAWPTFIPHDGTDSRCVCPEITESLSAPLSTIRAALESVENEIVSRRTQEKIDAALAVLGTPNGGEGKGR